MELMDKEERLQAEAKWLWNNREKYHGKWVLLDGSRLVASGLEKDVLAESYRPENEGFLMSYIQRSNEEIASGSSQVQQSV